MSHFSSLNLHLLMHWFRRYGWLHLPVSAPGALITLAAFAFCAQVFVAVDRHSHSATDTLYGIYPFIVPTLLLLDWIAARTAAPDRVQP